MKSPTTDGLFRMGRVSSTSLSPAGLQAREDPVILARLLLALARPVQLGQLRKLSTWSDDRFAAALPPVLTALDLTCAAQDPSNLSPARTLFVGEDEREALRDFIKRSQT